MVSRTAELVYAWVEPYTAYFIDVSPHGRWADFQLLEIIYRDFQHLLEPYQLNGLTPQTTPLTEEERRTLRKKNLDVMVDIDGRVLRPPGGGRNFAGGSAEVMFDLQKRRWWYQQAEKAIGDSIQKANTGDGCEKMPLPTHMTLRTIDHKQRQLVLQDGRSGCEVILHLGSNGHDFHSVEIRKTRSGRGRT